MAAPARLVAMLAVAALCACGSGRGDPAVQPARPVRIVSINQCADLLLLQLVDKERITSVSFLAGETADLIAPGLADGVRFNRGTAEDLINDRPDLILAGRFSTPRVREMARRSGANLVEVDSAADFADIRRIIRQVAAAVDEPVRGEAMIADMDATLAGLAAAPPPRPLRVVAWSGGNSVPGEGTLINAVIEAAGAENIAARPGDSFSSFDIEQLLIAEPDALLFGVRGAEGPSLQDAQGRHPLVRRLYAGRTIEYVEALHDCGLPQSAKAAAELRAALAELPAGGAGP